MAVSDCFFHGVEQVPDRCYQVCGECEHVYVVLGDVWAVQSTMGHHPTDGAAAFAFCPLCLHDF